MEGEGASYNHHRVLVVAVPISVRRDVCRHIMLLSLVGREVAFRAISPQTRKGRLERTHVGSLAAYPSSCSDFRPGYLGSCKSVTCLLRFSSAMLRPSCRKGWLLPAMQFRPDRRLHCRTSQDPSREVVFICGPRPSANIRHFPDKSFSYRSGRIAPAQHLILDIHHFADWCNSRWCDSHAWHRQKYVRP